MDALDNDGFSPLMLASRNGHRSTVEVLLRAGADTTPRATDSGDFSHMAALDVAAAQGHVGVVKALLGNGGDASAVDDHGCTALHYAAQHERGAPRNSVREEIQRALALLARAPADRTWRYRCWLVILRARAGREREARSGRSSSRTD
ncbi:Chain A, Sank E3_5: An Artificial Ankyrin Repeat Protein [Ectocarpus siliculosus]|uniref:Chain A, Sank E3_5: An Artificial Ankyrin Repeat Protein n=1 Tax=Ectocarpus siliculosus TaxID=2880 RepID=D8LE17_ECTSI|nr:Chain A, Sank E3_5: An Artificial Ankyrin Repeat Protein [Ectocarpus siliculosus]|eukprot:CBN78534.1 Chain A, Sank E3_5: An Artificial Ankyrin Repeat Protein [Ectocarpus siliculosus]